MHIIPMNCYGLSIFGVCGYSNISNLKLKMNINNIY